MYPSAVLPMQTCLTPPALLGPTIVSGRRAPAG
jgi:hypothetical protein